MTCDVALNLIYPFALEILLDEMLIVHLKVILNILQSSVIVLHHKVGILAYDVYLLYFLLVKFIEHPVVVLLVA